MTDQKDLPSPDETLPKPEKDLPLPEKELTAGHGSNNNKKSNANYFDNKSIIVILLLLFLYPIGAVLMWFWTKWPKKVKIILTVPFILGVIGLILAIFILNQVSSGDLTDRNVTPTPEPVFCAQEVMLCPDGETYVGRIPPSCEFEDCPKLPAESSPSAEEIITEPDLPQSTTEATLQ